MCFSAEANFGISALLLPAGLYCVHSAWAGRRSALCLALIPLIFSVQQFCEGLVWIGLNRDDAILTRQASLVFLAFALGFWPLWIPLCGFVLEPPSPRKWLLGAIALLGLISGLILYIPLALNPALLVTRAAHHSIHYDDSRSPVFKALPQSAWEAAYFLFISAPPFLCQAKGFRWFGAGIVASAIVSNFFFWYASTSVWCFFAAGLSLCLCWPFFGRSFWDLYGSRRQYGATP
jgi:hypothetical protein